MPLSSLTVFSAITDKAPISAAYVNAKFSNLTVNLTQLNTGQWSTGSILAQSFDSGGAVYNVTAFGAIGDNVTDDTAAFTKAHTAIPAGGAILWVSRGTYKLSSAFSITKPIVLMGAGNHAATLVQSATTADNVLAISASSVVVANLRLWGNGLLGSTVSSNVVYVGAANDISILDNSIVSAGLFGIQFSGVTQGRILRNHIDFTNPTLLSTNAADIQLQNSCARVTITDNRCLSPRKTAGIQLQPQVAGDIVQDCLVDGNLVSGSTIVSGTSNGHGISLYAGASAATVRRVIVTGNFVVAVVGMGIYLKGVNLGECADCIVIGNSIVSAQLQGSNGQLLDGAIGLSDARRCVVDGNSISSGGTAQSVAIGVLDDCSNTIISGNRVSNATGFAQGGFRAFASSTSSAGQLQVVGNMIAGPTGGSALYRASSGLRHLYQSNVGTGGNAQGFDFSTCSQFVLLNNVTVGNADYGIRIATSCDSFLLGFNTSFGDFGPLSDSGTSTMRYDAGGLVTFNPGSALVPSQNFRSERSLGWYRSAASVMALSYGGLGVKAGTNASCGTSVLGSNGSVNVATTYVAANDLIFLTDVSPGGTIGTLEMTGIRAASGFTIASTNVADTSTVAWLIVRPT